MEQLNLIERYLAGNLTGTDLQDFENRLRQDPNFQVEVDSYKDIIRGIELAGEKEFMQKVSQWEKRLQTEQPFSVTEEATVRSLRPAWSRYLAIAAGILAVFVIGWYLITQSNSKQDLIAQALTPEQAFTTYYSPFPDKVSVRGRGTRLVKEAMALYNSGAYEASVVKMDSLIQSFPDDHRFLLYKGISLVETGNAAEAIPLFQEVGQGPSEFADEGSWYHALALLKAGNVNEARGLLEDIVGRPRHDHKAEAREILNRLTQE